MGPAAGRARHDGVLPRSVPPGIRRARTRLPRPRRQRGRRGRARSSRTSSRLPASSASHPAVDGAASLLPGLEHGRVLRAEGGARRPASPRWRLLCPASERVMLDALDEAEDDAGYAVTPADPGRRGAARRLDPLGHALPQGLLRAAGQPRAGRPGDVPGAAGPRPGGRRGPLRALSRTGPAPGRGRHSRWPGRRARTRPLSTTRRSTGGPHAGCCDQVTERMH